MNRYIIRKSDMWDNIEPLKIDNFPWDKTGYKPKTTAWLRHFDDCLFVRFEAEDNNIRAVNTEPNSPVCQDSCVEFFVIPDPENTKSYINFEVNPLGTLFLSVGENINERTFMDQSEIKITPYIDSPVWSIELAIPFEFLKPAKIMRGNLYKCGDLSKYPHHACWNLVGTERPDFHRPEYFGELVIG